MEEKTSSEKHLRGGRMDSSEVEEKPKRDWLKIILFSLVGVFILTGVVYAGYWYGVQQGKKIGIIAPTPTPFVTPFPTPTPTPDPTADWKVYENEEYAFELKYPTNWTVNESDFILNKGYLEILSNERFAEIEKQTQKGISHTAEPEIQLRVFDAVEKLPPAGVEKTNFALWAKDFMAGGCGDSSVKEKDFQGSQAFEIATYSCYDGGALKFLAISRGGKFYLLEKTSDYLLLEKTGDTKAAEKVFSTFKFLD